MATTTSLRRVAALVAATLCLTAGAPGTDRGDWRDKLDADELQLVGFAGHVPDSTKPQITAFFPQESYPVGGTAILHIVDTASRVEIQVHHAGTDFTHVTANDVMTGRAVSAVRVIGNVGEGTTVDVRLGSGWESGLYFVRLTSGDRVGYASFVLRPRRLGEHPIAIVMPTQTWQAYNFRDGNHDGVPDTWYASGSTASLSRPFLNRGVPPHYKYYDVNFLRWAHFSGHAADYLSDADLNSASGAELRKAYQLVIFEGHHEYVTQHEYDAVTAFRNTGGNLMFLSANNFFWKITIDHHNVMTRVAKWRDLGRPEASLIGVQYYRNDLGQHRGPWIIRPSAARLPWLIDGTGLQAGMEFSSGGIEADDVTSDSPKNVQIVAAIPNLYGDGRDADMTYYETASGAKVFAAGAFTLAGSIRQKPVRILVTNLWERLARD
jgi:hypothetical protein